MSIFGGTLGGFSGSSAYNVQGIDYSGSGQYMRRGSDLTGNADGQKGTWSVWVRLDGGDTTNMQIVCNTGQFTYIRRNITNLFEIDANTSAGGAGVNFFSNNTYTSGATWRHVLASYDGSTGAFAMYVNDVSDLLAGGAALNVTYDYTRADWSVGDNTAGIQLFNGALAEIFFHENYIDLSVTSNRRKFISATGKPVNLGATGSIPFGVQPIIYFSSKPGDSATTFNTNLGSGGNFTITGSPTVASSSPSD